MTKFMTNQCMITYQTGNGKKQLCKLYQTFDNAIASGKMQEVVTFRSAARQRRLL